MSNQLQDKLDQILEDKNINLLPENLKAGITCLGVEGNLEVPINSPTNDRMGKTVTVTDITLSNPSTSDLLAFCKAADNHLENYVTTQYFGNYYETDGNYWISIAYSPNSKSFTILIQSSKYGSLMYNDVDVVAAGYKNDTNGKQTGWYFAEDVPNYSKATDEQITELLSHFKNLDYVVKTTAETENDLAFVPNMCEILDKAVTVDIFSSTIDTSDATATADDIARDKTAYVNGEKITGNIYTMNNTDTENIKATQFMSSYGNPETMQMDCIGMRAKPAKKYGLSMCWKDESNLDLYIEQSVVAEAIGLTADKIKSGETILGITGTYTGKETDVNS